MNRTISIMIAGAIAIGANTGLLSPSLACPGGRPLLAQAELRADNGSKPIGPPRVSLPEPAALGRLPFHRQAARPQQLS